MKQKQIDNSTTEVMELPLSHSIVFA